MGPRIRDDSVLDDLEEVFSRLPWWAGIPAVAVTYIGVNFAVVQISLLAPANRTFAAAGLVAFTAVFGQIHKVRRGKLVRLGSTLEGIRSLSWQRFEELVQEAFVREGYKVRPTVSGADGGVDLVLRRDDETTFVQCKAWRKKQVGVDRIRELFGVVAAKGADAGIVVSSGAFTSAAREFADGIRLRLIDGEQLVALLDPVRRDLPPKPEQRNSNPQCPRCGSEMVVRTAQRGARSGNNFLGCSRYPSCRGTRALPLPHELTAVDVGDEAPASVRTSTLQPPP